MRGHIAEKRGRYYLVLDVGRDPGTGKRKQRWHSGPDRKGYSSKRAAERAMREMLTSVDRSEYVDPTTLTTGEYLEAWLPTMRLRASTMDVYRVQLRAYVVPRIGAVRLQQLTPSMLDSFYMELERAGGQRGRALSAKTVRNVHVMLHRALESAVQRSLIARNPASLAEKPKPKTHEINPWTAAETARFLGAAEGDRLYAAFMLMATAGLRRGEALGLVWSDLDLERAALSVRRALVLVGNVPTMSEPKTEAGRRSVPLAGQAVAALRAHRRMQAEERLAFADVYLDRDLVFAREDGSPTHPGRLLDAFHRIGKAAGLRSTRPHDLRHGWATRALEAGVPAKVVQEVLGHSSAMVTLDIYSHVAPSMRSDATQLVADLVTGKR
jgi:integrase